MKASFYLVFSSREQCYRERIVWMGSKQICSVITWFGPPHPYRFSASQRHVNWLGGLLRSAFIMCPQRYYFFPFLNDFEQCMVFIVCQYWCRNRIDATDGSLKMARFRVVSIANIHQDLVVHHRLFESKIDIMCKCSSEGNHGHSDWLGITQSTWW